MNNDIESLKIELAKAIDERDLANSKLEVYKKHVFIMRKVLIDYDRSDVGYLLWNAERNNIIRNTPDLKNCVLCISTPSWFHKEFAPDDNIFYRPGESRPEGCVELFTKVKF